MDSEWLVEKEREVYAKRNFVNGLRTYHNVAFNILKNKKGKVLELGCHDGLFLEKLKNNGFEVEGIEFVPELVKKCREKGIRVKVHDLNKKFPHKDESFDIIIALEVLEHLHNYEGCMAEIKRALKKGGMFIMSSPNMSYWRVILSLLKGRFPKDETDRHIANLSLYQWKELMQKYFTDVRFYHTEKVGSKLFFMPKKFSARRAFLTGIKTV